MKSLYLFFIMFSSGYSFGAGVYDSYMDLASTDIDAATPVDHSKVFILGHADIKDNYIGDGRLYYHGVRKRSLASGSDFPAVIDILPTLKQYFHTNTGSDSAYFNYKVSGVCEYPNTQGSSYNLAVIYIPLTALSGSGSDSAEYNFLGSTDGGMSFNISSGANNNVGSGSFTSTSDGYSQGSGYMRFKVPNSIEKSYFLAVGQYYKGAATYDDYALGLNMYAFNVGNDIFFNGGRATLPTDEFSISYNSDRTKLQLNIKLSELGDALIKAEDNLSKLQLVAKVQTDTGLSYTITMSASDVTSKGDNLYLYSHEISDENRNKGTPVVIQFGIAGNSIKTAFSSSNPSLSNYIIGLENKNASFGQAPINISSYTTANLNTDYSIIYFIHTQS